MTPEGPGATLRRHGLRPRKRLGQNFLRDRRYLDAIVRAADLAPQDTVVEIGAGTGVLTRVLADRAARVLAIELDDSLAAMLRQEIGGHGNVQILHENALDFDPCSQVGSRYKAVGNIPYYITGPLLRHFLETPCPPEILVLMMQREVAQRLTAVPGDMSLLSVSVQVYAEPRIVTRVPAGAFLPRPKVDSAIVQLRPRASRLAPDLRERFFTVARAGFGTRRKTIENSLQHGLGINRGAARAMLIAAGVDPLSRAEDLSLDQWQSLAQAAPGAGT